MVIAHQGGWDEILLVLLPLALFAVLLLVAQRRASRLPHPDAEPGAGEPAPTEAPEHER